MLVFGHLFDNQRLKSWALLNRINIDQNGKYWQLDRWSFYVSSNSRNGIIHTYIFSLEKLKTILGFSFIHSFLLNQPFPTFRQKNPDLSKKDVKTKNLQKNNARVDGAYKQHFNHIAGCKA